MGSLVVFDDVSKMCTQHGTLLETGVCSVTV